jgi:copper chaperone NosL
MNLSLINNGKNTSSYTVFGNTISMGMLTRARDHQLWEGKLQLLQNDYNGFKFDDLSCLVKYMKISEPNKTEFAHMVVNQFDKPGEFIEISKAFFINSPNIKSPMLGNTASFIDQKTIDDLMQNDKEAKKITWNELLTTLQ